MTTRKALLRAMTEGYFGPGPVDREVLDQVRPGLLAALDAVEPLIRADERDQRAEIRAEVIALLEQEGPHMAGWDYALRRVLAAIDGKRSWR